MQKYLTYEQFGAVGDGVADDMPAIVRTHAEANRLGLPVRARDHALYRIANRSATAEIGTDTDWGDASFVIDDRDLDRHDTPVFHVKSLTVTEAPFAIDSLRYGQTHIDNPTGKELFVRVWNDEHIDYIRYGGNQDDGTARYDCLNIASDGTLSTPVSFDFDKITRIYAETVDTDTLTLSGGHFTTIANRCESFYNYHNRGITVDRSRVRIHGLTHAVTGELEHGAPYNGFLIIAGCAHVTVEDCVFCAHRTYYTMGSGGVTVPMGTYDIGFSSAIDVAFRNCRQTTDITDRAYWGLIGSNNCREILVEDCTFSRFDAHMGVTDCTIRRTNLGWMGITAIGFGTFTLENVTSYGDWFVNLREDFGCSWRGKFVIRDCTWHCRGKLHPLFRAMNPGVHDFGYECVLPDVEVDGFTVLGAEDAGALSVYCDPNRGKPSGDYPMRLPERVTVRGKITGAAQMTLCSTPNRMPDTCFTAEYTTEA